MRPVACLAVAATLACASSPAPPDPSRQVCDPEGFATRPAAERARIDSAFAAEPRMEEIRLTLRAPAQTVRPRVIAAMLACDVPVSQSSGDVIEARYGEETGLIGNYELTTHAYVVALDDSTTLVRLTGTETAKRGAARNPTINTKPVSNKNMGRSRHAWLQLRNVAKQLRADEAMRADLNRSTSLGIVFSQ